jgi:hypothetical protein
MQIGLTTFVRASICSFSFYMEDNRQSIQFYLLCTVSSFLRYFSHMKNERDDLVSRTDWLVDTSYCHRWKPDVLHILLQHLIEISATNVFLSFDIFNLRTSLLLGSMATQSQIRSEPTLI